ncbi:hypothetical protein [Paenibacillus larvae]|uniref:hypothetical protein n=1 Tax=Paenibacillus larvae TaxID=1464 RepID=UPI0012BAD59F|nr:hypothetical protein [Paenibacillus larvae]MCY7522381.1 hypothetical protein [Paenibacillus larvae]MCY9503271.1 hypothetical protein [Paenibacillus larvae]MCY9681168.1 hypothetical protein [Paenibacillus larvae]MCY9748213.1 hypothetical protein [Paenibacillus larvae]MCY9752381.1 hypothetical protein [Paenibacillus larvae]
MGGEFKQVGKIAGKATELEAKANKITKSMVTETKGTAKGSIKSVDEILEEAKPGRTT